MNWRAVPRYISPPWVIYRPLKELEQSELKLAPLIRGRSTGTIQNATSFGEAKK
jgi:hypothetical protein